MSRYNKGLVKDIQQEMSFKADQKKLINKYGISEEKNKEIIVVEKTNAYKFTVKTLVALLKTSASIILITLAIIGLTTLVYPSIRSEFFYIINEIILQLKAYMPR